MVWTNNMYSLATMWQVVIVWPENEVVKYGLRKNQCGINSDIMI